MRYTRLAIEAQGRTLKLGFHPRFTVITGVGSATRESMVQELIAGLGTNRSGTHLEIQTDANESIAVFRPPEAPHRVIDTSSGQDVSPRFRSSTGTIDVLGAFGLDTATARRWMRIGPNDLVATSSGHQLIARLGRINQSQLWSAAQRVQIAKENVEAQGPEGVVEDADLTERIDRSYQSHDDALEQADKTRVLAIGVGTFGLAGSAIVASTSVVASILLLVVAAIATLTAFIFRKRVTYYEKRLAEALGEAGSDSYLGYQLSRIDNYVVDEHHRRHRAAAQDDLDATLRTWRTVAGDVTVDWALEHRPAIEASAKLHDDRGSTPDTGEELVATHAADETPELIESLLARLGRARQLGSNGEAFPLLLDEPFGTLDPMVRPALLEVLVAQAGTPQIILLTNEEDVVAWARLEAITGALSLVGPGDGIGDGSPAAPSQAESDRNAGQHPNSV
jgi:hypothetical protein